MLPTDDDCDDCVPDYMKSKASSGLTLLWALQPFILTFCITAFLALTRLFPFLSGETRVDKPDRENSTGNGHLPSFNNGTNSNPVKAKSRSLSLVQLVFACNVGLSAVLVELLLCEVSGLLDRSARQTALSFTLPSLLALLIVIAPGLEVYSILRALGLVSSNGSQNRWRRTWFAQTIALTIWLAIFWSIGYGALGMFLRDKTILKQKRTFTEGCLERIGVIGISLLAVLSGFAAISAPWQAFGSKQVHITDADVAKKQIGLETAEDMLHTKRSRLRALAKRMDDSTTAKGTFFTRITSTFRGSAESQERVTLAMEISGLETMQLSLSNTLYTMKMRQAAQARSKTAIGRLLNALAYAFAIYCIYRLATTSLSMVRRILFPGYNFRSGTDPVTNILALLTTHYDESLDVAAWSRQISFLLSGVMLLLSFNSALQTFLLLGRAFPGILSAFHANLALVVSQIMGTYVISSALLLRSNLPKEMGSAISEALGAPLEPRKVDAWFETWFLGAAAVTIVGIWLGRHLNGVDDEDGSGTRPSSMELGKMN